jgi:transposase InsO family protein
MPFMEPSRLEQRVQMLADYDAGGLGAAAVCELYGVSRETLYFWRRRRASGDLDWFRDGSHAPKTCPQKTPAAVVEAVIAVKRRYPYFGPKKIKAWLERHRPQERWPAASTLGDILKAAGLVTARTGRRRGRELGGVAVAAPTPNAEWACDFKGWFRTRDGTRCDPLTITDTASRYLIEVRITEPTTAGVRPVFEQAFEEHGLPEAIRCDNGAPFGANSAAGLTRLSVWWLKLGIRPHFIRPGSPQDNGRHERMHRTLKHETARTAADDARELQARFDLFRDGYNRERPHEALEQKTPGQIWRRSPRTMPERLLEPWYDADHQVRQVRTSGEIKWKNQLVFVSEPLAGEPVGLFEGEDGKHLVRYFDLDLGVIDRNGRFQRFAPQRYRLREPLKPADQTPKLSGIMPVQSVRDHSGCTVQPPLTLTSPHVVGEEPTTASDV